MTWTKNIALMALAVTLSLMGHAQISYVPTLASDCSACDGTVEITLPELTNVQTSIHFQGVTEVATQAGITDSFSFSGLCPGYYTIEVAYLITGVVETYPFTISVPGVNAGIAYPAFSCTNTSSLNLGSLITGEDAGGVWTDPFGNVINPQIDPDSASSGTYTYTLNSGCGPVITQVWLTINEPADPGIGTTYLICETYPVIDMFDVLFGDPQPGGEWFAPGGIPHPGFYDPAVDQTAIFVYEIDTVQGCPAVYNTLYVIENQLPDPGVPAQVGVCPNAFPFDMTGYLGGTPQTGGVWTNSNNQVVSTVFDPAVLPPGTYTYTVSGSTPCPAQSSSLTIYFTDGIDAGEDGSVAVCEDNAMVDLFDLLQGTPDPGGIWTAPDGTSNDSGIIDPALALAGDYIYTVQAAGCPDETAIVNLQIDELVDAGLDQSVMLCASGEMIELSDFLESTATIGGTWTNTQGDPVGPTLPAVEASSGTYSYSISGGLCPDDLMTLVITLDEAPNAGPDQSLALCSTMNAIDLNSVVNDPGMWPAYWENELGEVVPSSYDPANGSADLVFIIPTQNNCPADSAFVQIEVDEPIGNDVYLENSVCSNDPLINLNNWIPVEIPLTGFWEYNGEVIDPPVIDPDELWNGLYTYTPILNSACPPPVVEVEFVINVLPDAGNGGSLTVCANQNEIILDALPDPDVSDLGAWTFNGDQVSPGTFYPTVSGTLVYTIAGADPCPADQAEWEIQVLPVPMFDAGSDLAVCTGSQPLSIGSQGAPGMQYSWSPQDHLSDPTSAQPIISFENPDNDLEVWAYVVEVSDGVCVNSDTVLVEVFPIPEFNLGPDLTICEGETFNLQVPQGIDAQWDPELWVLAEDNGSFEFLPEESGVLSAVFLNEFGCASSDELEVEVLESPDLQFEVGEAIGCPPLEVELINLTDPMPGVQYYWEIGGQQFSLDGNVTLEQSGTYSVSLHAVSDNGCSYELSEEGVIQVYPAPLANFQVMPSELNIYEPGLDIIQLSFGGLAAEWTLNGTLVSEDWIPEFEIPVLEDVEQQVCLEIWNEYLCSSQHCETVIYEGDFTLYVPNAFSPNGDGRNEAFFPVMRGIDPTHYNFEIFDRWGEKIFASDDPEKVWMGNVNDGDYYVPPDLYVWQIKVRNRYTGEDVSKRGHVVVIR